MWQKKLGSGRNLGVPWMDSNYYCDEGRKLQDWLNAPDCSINYSTALNRRVDGTGQWILKDPTYLVWKEQGSVLWIQGQDVIILVLKLVLKDCYHLSFHSWVSVLMNEKFILN
ncbi:hypothetical protein FB446DRAFT_708486 [Lentinula raphanica]|nr:hypothetical protein FB446DRAFT_708486 [Lentinula raphanica]